MMPNIYYLYSVRLYSSSAHLYRNLHPWKSRSELSQHLYESILYNQGGLIAINKPYGIPVNKAKENESKQNVKQMAVSPLNGNSPYCVEDCLPHLMQLLNEKQLQIIKSTERYSSGIVLLASNKRTSESVAKAIRRGRPKLVSHLVYWAVTKGCPTTSVLKERVAIMLKNTSGEEKQPVIMKKFSKEQVKKQLVKPVMVEYHILHSNNLLRCSVVEIAVSSAKWNFMKIYMTTKACYILGDVAYSSRVKEVLGQVVTINPQDIIAYNVQPLSRNICDRLNIPSTSSNSSVPVMLHLQSVTLTGYNNGKDLIIVAPVPPYFAWTCEKLDLVCDTTDFLQISCK